MTQLQRIAAFILLSLFFLQIFVSAEDESDKKKMTVTIVNQQQKSETLVGFEKTGIDTPQESTAAIKIQKSDEEPAKNDKSTEEKSNDSTKEQKPQDIKSSNENKAQGSDKSNEENKPQGTEEEKMKEQGKVVSQSKNDATGMRSKSGFRQSDHYHEDEEEHTDMDESHEHHEHEEHEEMHSHHDMEEDITEGYMGDEIEHFMGEPHDTSEEEESSPASTAPEEEESSAPSNSSVVPEEVISADAAANTTKVPTTPTGPRPPVPQVTGCKTQGQIALTYSEGPSDVTAKIVRQLTKADARANFFVNATWLYTQQYAMVAQNIYNAGHFIGMTYRVKNDDPEALTDEQIRDDIISNAHTIESIINVAPKYVRLHYTETKDIRTEGILQDLGFIIVGYNLDSQDYFKKDATGPGSIDQIYSDTFIKYKDTYDAKGSFISIQYDLPYTGSLAAIPHIINTIEQEGYTMVRMDGCLNDPTPYKKSANSTEYISDKFSLGQPKYHQGQKSIVIETPEEAKEADEQFNMQGMQGLEGLESMANTRQVSMSFFLVIVGVIFTFCF